MARTREVARAKRRFLEAASNRDWLVGAGIGLVDDRLGLVINVTPRAKAAARRLVNQLTLQVPVALREIEQIRAQPPRKKAVDDEEDLAALRRIANRRMGRDPG